MLVSSLAMLRRGCWRITRETNLNFTSVILMTYLEHRLAHDKISRTLWNFVLLIILLSNIHLRSASPLSFLDLCLSISDARITTTIHYKATDTHSYLDYRSSHPPHCKKAIPYGQFLRLRRICSDDDEYEAKSKEMASFFENRGYPRSVVTNSQRRTQEISRERALGNSGRGHRARCADKIPLVLTYHPKNQEVKKILLKNFRILSDEPTTKEIFNTKPLCVYRRDTSLRDILPGS